MPISNGLTKEGWELKDKRDFAVRIYNSFAINNPDMKHEEITKRVEKVIKWLFDTYKEEVKGKEEELDV